MVTVKHPSSARLARKLRLEQNSNPLFRQRNNIVNEPPKKKPRYEQINNALRTMTNDFGNREIRQYLRDIVRVIEINVA